MNTEESYFHTIANSIPESNKGQLFGKACYKIYGKAFCCFFQDSMVFKLKDIEHKEASSLNAACLFDPSGKNRPMKEWVQLPYEYANLWSEFAIAAAKYVGRN